MAIWLFSFPPSISSDDAFFFLRGIERYSILEFRPHFPGYPGFIFLGKILHSFFGLPALQALSLLSISTALSIPILGTLIAQNNKLLVFLCCLTMPLLPYLGLSMMSDGCGIAFILAAIWQYQKTRWSLCGFLLGMALICRPSFIAPIAVFIIADLLFRQRIDGLATLSAITCITAYSIVFAWEQMPLLWEAIRFTQGHFLVWGNTTLSPDKQSWIDSFSAFSGGAIYITLLAICVIATSPPLRKHPLTYMMLAAWLWTILFQNPENLRHLALPITLTVILLSQTSQKPIQILFTSICVIQIWFSLPYFIQHPQQSALHQISQIIKDSPETFIYSNHGLYFLRENLPEKHIFDRHYEQVILKSSLFITTSIEIEARESTVFSPRVFGEKTFYLFKP